MTASREKILAAALADKLRRLGYDAYVNTAKSEPRGWHRVRVGQLSNPREAAELRNTLRTKSVYKDAFITVY